MFEDDENEFDPEELEEQSFFIIEPVDPYLSKIPLIMEVIVRRDWLGYLESKPLIANLMIKTLSQFLCDVSIPSLSRKWVLALVLSDADIKTCNTIIELMDEGSRCEFADLFLDWQLLRGDNTIADLVQADSPSHPEITELIYKGFDGLSPEQQIFYDELFND